MKFQYPNLLEALEILKDRANNVSVEHKPIIDKWVEQLGKINKQMRHLERIESFSSALTDKEENHDQ